MARIGIDARLWHETGVGRYIRNLVSNLEKLDTKNEYFLFFRKSEFESVEFGSKNFHKRLADISWHTIAEQAKMPAILKTESLDLVHFPYFSVPALYTGSYVVTVHDLILHHFPTGKASTKSPLVYWTKYLGYKLALSRGIKNAKKVITVSEATKEELVDHFHLQEGKITVTREGIDDKVLAKKPLKFHTTNKYFLYVGNAYPHKNLERLLLAFDKLRRTTVDPVHLVFVGKEDYFYKRLKQKVHAKGLSSSVIFYENISDTDLSLLYQHAIALVMPSLMEGFGLPALEALANNCLVVASDIPALHEVCRDAALYFDPKDVEDIYKMLHAVMHSSASFIKSKQAIGKKLIKNFSWAEMAKQTLAVYESCISV
ncbi:MAG: glycosyltransferase family 4 protein [Patescibacteria group bacterium]|nr:glycosyltransferase family 4 protein [Patescibacteria group bacterium]